MTELDLDAIEARAKAATPGPWQWFGNTGNANAYLATTHGGRRFIMTFARWGMKDAQPCFQITGGLGGVMVPLAKLPPEAGPKFEVEYRRDFIGIAHPDAEFIAKAREDVDAMAAEIRRLQAWQEQAVQFLENQVCSDCQGQPKCQGNCPHVCPAWLVAEAKT